MVLARSRILIADDEPNVLATMSAILRQEGYDVEEAQDGAQAVAAIGRTHFDLVLTDLNMPGVDGLGVLAAVRQRSPSTVTVVVTGYASIETALTALQLGAYEYLFKPTEVNDLKQAVRRSLERKRLSEIDTLYRVGQSIVHAHDVGAIAAVVADAVRDVLGVRSATVVALDDVRSAAGPGDSPLRKLLWNPVLLGQLAAGVVLTSNAPDLVLQAWARQSGVHSFALVPGIANGRLACVLFAEHGERFEFHASGLRFLQGLAGQTALAVQNASLIAELRQNNQALEAANRKLQQLDQLKSQFLSIATHELRTPLSIILGYNSMLAETLHDRLTAEERRSLADAVSACKRLIRLVNSMLDVNQIEAGKMKMEMGPLDVRELVRTVSDFFTQEARERGIALRTDVPIRIPSLEADSERMQQVLINLLGNALKFTARGGSVTLSVRQRDDLLELAVSDTGIGISTPDQACLFDEFAQIGRQNRERQREGSGLGLAIARRIVEAHQGAISVSSSPGVGSTFTVRLPAKAKGKSAKRAVSA